MKVTKINTKDFKVTFPEARKALIVETGLMQRTANRTLAVHPLGGLCVWHGRSRIGKTTTALWLASKIAEAHDPTNPASFRAKHYEVGEIPPWHGQESKRGVRSLYHATVGRLDEGIYRQYPIEDIAEQLVHGLRRKSIQMVFIDEAGWLSLDAIRGMVLVSDVAKNLGWTLTLVLVGMDDLPQKLVRKEQIHGRVIEWCYFEPYNLNETWDLLAALSSYFNKLDRKNEYHREQVTFIHETYGGIPGNIVPFLRRLEYRLEEHKGEVDLTLLRVVHLLTLRDKQRSIEDSAKQYKGKIPVGESGKDKDSLKKDSKNKSRAKSDGKKKNTSRTARPAPVET
jgi:hypothetical protein